MKYTLHDYCLMTVHLWNSIKNMYHFIPIKCEIFLSPLCQFVSTFETGWVKKIIGKHLLVDFSHIIVLQALSTCSFSGGLQFCIDIQEVNITGICKM